MRRASAAARQLERRAQVRAGVVQHVVPRRQPVCVWGNDEHPADRACAGGGREHGVEHPEREHVPVRGIERAAQPSLASQARVDRDERPTGHVHLDVPDDDGPAPR